MISIAEKKMISCIEKNQHILAFVIVSILGFIIRTFGFNFISDDMANFLIPWFYEISVADFMSCHGTALMSCR